MERIRIINGFKCQGCGLYNGEGIQLEEVLVCLYCGKTALRRSKDCYVSSKLIETFHQLNFISFREATHAARLCTHL